MVQFSFTALDRQNQRTSGTVHAADRESALRQLARTYATVVGLEEVRERRSLFGRRVSTEEILMLTQQLASMLRAGIGLKSGMEIIQADVENPVLRDVLSDVSRELAEGKSLSESLSRHPTVFSHLYVYMVEAGEESGKLPYILSQLALYIEQAEGLRRRVTAALYYPLFILAVALVISVFIFVFGVRQFEEIYAGMDASLPPLTRIVMGAGNVVWQYGWALILIAVLGVFASARYLQSDTGQARRDAAILRIPVIGPLMKRLAIARFARTLCCLYAGGVPLLHSLQVVAGSMGNRVLESVVLRSVQNVQEGESLSRPLRDSGIFTSMSISMIATGEESGTLETMLTEIASFYEAQVDVMLRGLVSLLEPIVIVGVGVMVAVLILALGLPMLNLVQML